MRRVFVAIARFAAIGILLRSIQKCQLNGTLFAARYSFASALFAMPARGYAATLPVLIILHA